MTYPLGFNEVEEFSGYIPKSGHAVFRKIEDRPSGLMLATSKSGLRAIIDPLASYEVEEGIFVVSMEDGIVSLVV